MVRIASIVMVVCGVLLVPPAQGQPQVQAVVNGASFEAVISPGSLVSIFGERLAGSMLPAKLLPLPDQLGTTTVTVGGRRAPLYFVSPGQINAQLPFETGPGRVNVVVTTQQGVSNAFPVDVAATSPGIFTRGQSGRGQAVYFSPEFQWMDLVNPGDVLVFYANGLGATNPPGVSGEGGKATEPFQRAVAPPEVWIGDMKADVLFAGLAPGFAGVFQVNALVKPGLATERFFVRAGGKQSNIAEIRIRGGQNASGAGGTIEAVYPANVKQISFSPLPLVARFRAEFTIRSDAQPFRLKAVSATGSTTIVFNTQNGTYDATVTVPSAFTRVFNFGDTEITAVDLAGLGQPFAGNIVPLGRWDVAAVAAFDLLPPANAPVLGSSTWEYRTTGQARRGTKFVIDDNNHPELSRFAGFVPAPYNPGQKFRDTPVRLYIDGELVASTDVGFRTP